MDKKPTNRAVIIPFIQTERAAGKSDQEIYRELTAEYFDKKTIALLITGTAKEEAKRKYAGWNITLMVLLALGIVSKIYVLIQLTRTHHPMADTLTFYAACFAYAYLIYAVSKYQAVVYQVCILIPLLSFSESVDKFNGVALLVESLISITLIFVAWYTKISLFPNYSINKMKKDENGDFIMEKKKVLVTEDVHKNDV